MLDGYYGQDKPIKFTEEELNELTSYDLEGDIEEEILFKYFLPMTERRWYAVTASPELEDDVMFYGYIVDGDIGEWGYFMLSDLNELESPLGHHVQHLKDYKGYQINLETNLISKK